MPQVPEVLIGVLAEGQASSAAAGLCGVLPYYSQDPVSVLFPYHGRVDLEPAGLEIDRGPAEPQQLRPAQAVEAGQENGDGDRLVLGQGKQLGDLLYAVRRLALILGALRLCRQIGGVLADVPVLHRPLQGAADDGVVLDDGVGVQALPDLGGVVVLQIAGRQLAQGDPPLVEVRGDVDPQHIDVLVVGGDSDVRAVELNPVGDVP